MNGPTERAALHEAVLWHDRCREAEARVAVLEQQIAAIEALSDEVETQARMADESIPDATVSISAIWDALAAGVDPKGSMVVDNPTKAGRLREVDVSQGNANPVTFAPGAISSSWHQMDDPYQRPIEGSPS